MAFRISQISEGGEVVFHVDGDLDGEAAVMLRRQLSAPEAPVRAVALDLTEVRSADASGTALLCEVEQEGLELRGASRYLELLIESRRENESAKQS